MAKTFKRKMQLFLVAVFGIALGLGYAVMPKTNEAKAAVATEYTVVEAPMMGGIQDCYAAGGNLNLFITIPGLDNEVDGDGISFAGVDLATVFNEFGFFDNVMIGGKTLRELGCTSFWDNTLGYNVGEPKPRIYLHAHFDPAILAAAIADGTVNYGHTTMSTITIKEGTKIPGYRYLMGLDNAVVYEAGCDFTTEASTFLFERTFIGTTEVQSLKYIQDNGDGTGYFGISLFGDDFAGVGVQEDGVATGLTSSITTWYYNDTVLLNGEAGKVGAYSLVNLGSKGQGYYAFYVQKSEAELTSVTIPAGTKFPMYYYRGAQGSGSYNNGNKVVSYFEIKTTKTFVKDANGVWYAEGEEVVAEEIATEVVMAMPFYGDGVGNDYFLNFELSVNDYAGLNTYGGTAITATNFLAGSNFDTHVLINDQPFSIVGESYLNVWGVQNVFSTRGNVGNVGFTNATQINEITILAGCKFPTREMLETGVNKYYVTTKDVTFIKVSELNWVEKPQEIATEVAMAMPFYQDGVGNDYFLNFELSVNDYAGLNTYGGTAITATNFLAGSNFDTHVLINDQPFSIVGETYLNVWNVPNVFSTRGHVGGVGFTNATQIEKITILAGCKFPTREMLETGVNKYYVTTEDVTFVKVSELNWEKESSDYRVTFMVDGEVYTTRRIAPGGRLRGDMPADPVKAEDAQYTYTFTGWKVESTGNNFTQYSAVNSDLVVIATFDAEEKPVIDITGEISFVHQAQQVAGTETYLIRTQNLYWTKNPKGGCLNEYDCDGLDPVGGQVQMKYIYFNGKSLYDINREDNGAYGSSQENIVNGGQYAPIVVFMNNDNGIYSYIQIHVPTAYAEGNHQSFAIKSGFSVTENGNTWVVTEDIEWINLNGTWTNAKDVVLASDFNIGEGYIAGNNGELLAIEVSTNKWNFIRDPYDYNYYSSESFVGIRKNIYINGVSIFEINTTVDDSAYTYVTSPQTVNHTAIYNSVTYDTFANPVYLYGSGDTLTIYIHIDYLKTLGVGDITLKLGAGLQGFITENNLSNPLLEDVSRVVSRNCEVLVDDLVQIVLKGKTAKIPATPQKDMTSTTVYVFDNWYEVGANDPFDFATPILGDIQIESRYIETNVQLIETEVNGIVHHLKTDKNDNWMIFYLANHDYPDDLNTKELPNVYAELLRIGFFDRIIFKGKIELANGSIVDEATFMDIYNSYGPQEGPYFNIWGELGSLALRVPVGDGIEEIIIEEGCSFPSYAFLNGSSITDTRYFVSKDTIYTFAESAKIFEKRGSIAVDIQMEKGAAVRLTSDMSTSGLRFQTNVSAETIAELANGLTEGKYQEVQFGTLIVPTEFLMGGLFTHDWLEKNGFAKLDIPSSVEVTDVETWAKKTGNYYSYFGSIVKLKTSNYDREFSGIGYIKITLENGQVEYYYAAYDSANSRSAAFVAKAATEDRSANETGDYTNKIESDNNWSPYTENENAFLRQYITWANKPDIIKPETLTALENKNGTVTVDIEDGKQALDGTYVELVYSTNVNVWGVFTYTDGSKTVNEDFYLQAGTTNHTQFLDVYRVNGVGYGLNKNNLSMVSITFTNAELEQIVTGEVKILALYSYPLSEKDIPADQEIYLTVDQEDGSEMTVGAHLGLGGALTYLAKSGIYEGATASGYRSGNVKISTNTSDFVAERNTTLFGSKEAGYYGHATSSRPEDGAVNLINNVDAGRQIQQSWYASVGGGTDGAGNGANGYTRAFCKTESTSGKYWPYNPVQAGDVVSNPSQIIDYEINEAKGYIYVKARAMDWAKGQKSSDKLANTIVGGSTTKSYMENYYRLNSDGTLIVNNSYIDWNGFTDMELCDWASTELPAVYPVHTLNYYVSNIDGDGSWTDGLEYNSGLGSWTGDDACRQFASASRGYTKVEDWFAWANGGDGNAFALGVYIPNVERLTSGRARTTTAMSESLNRDAKSDNVLSDKGLMSNMQPIKYTYQSAYVSNTSYTAPGVDFRMEAYVKIEYSYVICLGTVNNIRATFKNIKDNGIVTNAGDGYQKVGLDAWARADKMWTW